MGIGGGAVGDLSIVLSFPVEGTDTSAAVEISQAADGTLFGRTDAPESLLATVQRQAARCLSVNHDGTGWPEVGQRDPVIDRLQRKYEYLRPVCFYSAYEAATSFVIGQRISRVQGARIKERLREVMGDSPTVDGHGYSAFPRPSKLVDLRTVRGLTETKTDWLRGLARAAMDGKLDTEALRELPYEEALSRLRALSGVGPWTAEAILLRGCGLVDELPSEEMSLRAAADLYGRPGLYRAAFEELAEKWRPYRMWAVVLLRTAWNREEPRSYRQ